MLDDRTRVVLQDTARRLTRSFLQYVDEAVPWTTDQEEPALGMVKRLAFEERDGIGKLLNFLQRQHATPPYLGSFPASFTSMNFVTFDFIRPLLSQHARTEVMHLENDLCQIENPRARELLKDLLALKIRHMKELEQFTPTAQSHAPGIPAATH